MLGAMGRAYGDFAEDLPTTHSKLEALEEFWLSKKVGKALPRRSQFDARSLVPWLPHIVLIDVEGVPPRFRVRLMGMGSVNCAGGDYTGKWVDDCVDERERSRVLEPYVQCASDGRSIKNHAVYITAARQCVLVHRLYLPCANDGKTVDNIILGLFCTEYPGRYYPKNPTKLHLT